MKRRLTIGLVASVVVAGLGVAGFFKFVVTHNTECRVASGSTVYKLDVSQAANATTIAAVGKRLGMPDHGITIALATAIRESNLHNLDHGDRDSLGLFQQRPSQGWGTPSQILTPHYAAAAFFDKLAKVPGWQQLSVTAAAQRVQRSGSPTGYAQFEARARAYAIAMTGESAAGLACRLRPWAAAAVPGPEATMRQELGGAFLDVAVTDARGWTVAAWLVGHAEQFHITSVSFAGRAWRPSAGTWVTAEGPPDRVRVTRGQI
jgi:hypothetical protein